MSALLPARTATVRPEQRTAWIRRLAAMLGVAAVAGGCSVADLFHVDPAAIQASAFSAAVPTLCRSALGSYALPKSFLKVTVARTNKDTDAPILTGVGTVVRADKSLTFCIDHMADPMADDEIRIIKALGQDEELYSDANPRVGNQFSGVEAKNYGSQLLQWVVSNTVNQSEYIGRILTRTAFIALSGNANFTPLGRSLSGGRAAGDPVPVAVLEYDPFNPEDFAIHNRRLRDLGYCLVLEGYTFDTRQMTAEQYCSAPRYVTFAFDEAYARYRSGPPPRIAGVAYRPRIKYALSIYRNDSPKGRGNKWRLDQQTYLAFENIAPIVSIGVTRSIFAARRVALNFDRGVLKAMCLVKTSELESAVAVPYEVAKSIVALPTQIFEVKIGNIGDNIQLLNAEKAVIAAQQQYLEFLTDETKKEMTNKLDKKEAVALPGIPNPIAPLAPATPTATSILPSSVATMATLKSDSVLKQICRDAPSIIAPGNRTAGGQP